MQQKYNFDNDSKLYADYLDKYSQCLIDLNRVDEGQMKIEKAVEIYKNKFMFVDAARAYLTLMNIHWNNFDYHKCMDVLEEALDIYNNAINKDKTFEIEIMFLKALLYGGIDRLEDSLAATQEALNVSKETNIYYRSDELYKNLAVINGLLGNLENFDYHLGKAKQFAVFTENDNALASIEVIYGLYANQAGKHKEAIQYLDKSLRLSENIAAFAYTEKAKSLYSLKEYEEALNIIGHLKYPNYTPFKYDYLHIWSSKIYEGLCLSNLSKPKEAIDAIKKGIEKMEVVGVSKALDFAYRSLSDVYSDMGDFEKAFTTLKKVNEIAEAAKANRLYY